MSGKKLEKRAYFFQVLIVFYKVIIGDSEFVLKSFSDSSIHLIITSPPYFTMRGEISWGSYEDYLNKMEKIFTECFRVLKEGRNCIVNVCDYKQDGIKYPIPFDFVRILREIGFIYEDDIIWVKPYGVGANNGTGKRAGNFIKYGFPLYFRPNNRYEHILIFRKGRINYDEYNKKEKLDYRKLKDYLGDVWEFATAIRNQYNVEKIHVAEFPEKLPLLSMLFYSLKNEVILDPFLGSGTTMKVARLLGRSCIGIEINPNYVEMIKEKVGFGQESLGSKIEYQILSFRKNVIPNFNTRRL